MKYNWQLRNFRSAENGMQGMGEIEGLIDNVNGTIDDLDTKLDKVLKRQEQDYLKGYTIYVKQKEKELQDLICNLNERNRNTTLKD